MKLCDLHTHVLPGVDDGAPDMEYALQMLRNAAASDVDLLLNQMQMLLTVWQFCLVVVRIMTRWRSI